MPDTPPPPTAYCMNCDTPVFLIDGRLPRGWDEVEDTSVPSGRSARCYACSQGSRKTAPVSPHTEVILPGCIAVDEPAPSAPLYSGCRVLHWPVGGSAVLRIHAGVAARPGGRDEPVQFLATPEVLDHLIIHLAAIRASIGGRRS